MKELRSSKIKGMGIYIPDKILTNADLEKMAQKTFKLLALTMLRRLGFMARKAHGHNT